jgi:hypothetical protein
MRSKDFDFFSNNRGVIRIRTRVSGAVTAGESRLPGVFITGESITNTNNFMNIRKNSKSLLDVPTGTRRSCLKKKTETNNLVTLFLLNTCTVYLYCVVWIYI